MVRNKKSETQLPTILRTLDSRLVELLQPGQLVHHYLLASYCYYILNESPWEDSAYDRLCRRLLECYHAFEHPQKHLINFDQLHAGTGYYLKASDYPAQIRLGIHNFIRHVNSGQLEADLFRIAAIGEEAWLKEYESRRNK